MAELVATDGVLKGLVVALEDRDEWIIGRDPDLCQIVLEDAKTSRKHVVIRHRGDLFFLENLSATNPVHVNDRTIRGEVELVEGDQIAIGGNLFRFYQDQKRVSLDARSPMEDKETIFREEEIHALPESVDLRLGNRFILKVISGPNVGAEYALDNDKDYVIGSDTSCDIIFHDLSISRQHAHLFIDAEGKMFIEDLQSRNGVIIDREKIVEKRALLPNSIVTLGTSSFLVIDKEAPSMTILSSEISEKKEEPRAYEQVAKTEDEKKPPIKSARLVLPLILGGLAVLLGIGAVSLFREASVHSFARDYNQEIRQVLQPFPAVRFTYNPNSGKLFLIGHVMTDLEKQSLQYNLQSLTFLKGIEDNVVVDDAIWQEMNLLMSKYADFEGVSMHSPEAGRFVLSGYLQTSAQKAALNDFMNLNFLYLNLLENWVIVEEEVMQDVKSKLLQEKFIGVVPEFSNGQLTLIGAIEASQDEAFKAFVSAISQLCGVRNVRNFVVFSSPEQHVDRMPGNYLVTGFSKYGNININVVINGKILMRGDAIDGYMITCIQPQTIFFEKDGLKYKLEYNK